MSGVATRGPAEPATSLDRSTQLGAPGWRFTDWPECAEASLAWVSPSAPFSRRRLLDELREERATADWRGASELSAAEVVLAEQEALRWARANGRAATKSRRYFVRNALRYMWVLTFALAERNRGVVMEEVSEFARRLRVALGGAALAYWYSPELHPGGHGWHVNFFVARWIDVGLVGDVWGQGFVWVTDFARSPTGPKGEPLGLCRTPREGWRRAARYGCKYAQKDWSAEHVGHANHRYEVAQGFAPLRHSLWVSGTAEAERLVSELVPAEAMAQLTVWDSSSSPNWDRPPVRTWRW